MGVETKARRTGGVKAAVGRRRGQERVEGLRGLPCAIRRLAAGVIAAAISAWGVWAPPPAVAQVRSIDDVRSILRADLPPDAMEIPQAMAGAREGETITIRGYVALSRDAFSPDQAVFLLVDESARTGERPSDPDRLPATIEGIPPQARATIRVVGSGHTPLRGTLRERHGLRPGAEVFVTGRVHSANGVDTLVVDARSLHVPRDPIPPTLFADAPLEDAVDVSEALARGDLKRGDRVVLRGRVGGSERPFVSGRAVFTLMGRGLKACNENPDDPCATPWDYCCEPRPMIAAHSVTVRVVDDRGRPLRTDLKGRRGLRELSEVVVHGTVAVGETGAVVVDAASIVVPR